MVLISKHWRRTYILDIYLSDRIITMIKWDRYLSNWLVVLNVWSFLSHIVDVKLFCVHMVFGVLYSCVFYYITGLEGCRWWRCISSEFREPNQRREYSINSINIITNNKYMYYIILMTVLGFKLICGSLFHGTAVE